LAYRWKVIAVDAKEAQEIGTGNYEPFFAIVQDDQHLILCKALVEDLDSRASEYEGN